MTGRLVIEQPLDDFACAPGHVTDRCTAEVSSATVDTTARGVGSSPWNDPTSSRVEIPETPSSDIDDLRYLARLAAVVVPQYRRFRIRGLRTAIVIGRTFVNRQTQEQYPVEFDQVSPFWRFTDGNVSFHLRILRGVIPPSMSIQDSSAGRLTDYSGGIDSALLVRPDGALGIEPPAAGIPPGDPLYGLGTIRDLRFPWNRQALISSIDYEIEGPATVTLYASIRQTNPVTRQTLSPLLPVNFPTNVLLPEDQFVLALENTNFPAIYRYVAGSILMETDQTVTRAGGTAAQGISPP